MEDLPKGLSTAEVEERRQKGLVNRAPRTDWRDYGQILSRNLLTWFNAMVTPAAIALFVLGEIPGGIAVSGMAVINSTLGLFQEIRAKHHLDKLMLLVESKARVIRDGQVQVISSGDVVQGEHILLESGDTVVADGPVLQANYLEIDEALLSGESDPVRRNPGDNLLSGSFCVTGEGCYRADKVGGEAFANNTSMEARRYRYTASPLTRVINHLIQILSFTAIGLCLLYTVAYLVEGFPKNLEQEREFVRIVAATITSMVPQGLVLTATISFTLGAIVMSRRGAVVQRLAAVETMAAIDVICTDKTGTLTTNNLHLAMVQRVTEKYSEEDIRLRLRQFASASLDKSNRNVQALKAALGEAAVDVLDHLPFKSQNRYSAVRIGAKEGERVLVLGAVEGLEKVLLPDSTAWHEAWHQLLPSGQRLLLFCLAVSPQRGEFPPFAGTLDGFSLEPLALVGLGDELRPEAGKVLEELAGQRIAFKVLSGDNPETVRATVSDLNLPLAKDPVVSGDELAGAADPRELICSRSVFGRVTPRQKVHILEVLKERGCHVAMIGDGVNDILPIKRADLGIAMGAGSQATKTVAGLVLENNDFALLPETLEEGRTILRNLRRSSKLFLVKNVYSLILILVCFTGVFGLRFPYLPQQVTLLNWLVIGVPALVIALSRERSAAATKPHFFWEVGWFALRTGVVFALAGLAMLGFSRWCWPDIDHSTQRTLLLSTLVFLGLTALFRALRDGEQAPLVGDYRFRLLGMLAIPVYLTAMYWPWSAKFFDLVPLSVGQWLLTVVICGVAYGLSLLSDRLLE
jgi:cation-transporting ATPase E